MVFSHDTWVVHVRHLRRDLHSLTYQASLRLLLKPMLFNNQRLVLGVDVTNFFLAVRFVGEHFLRLLLVIIRWQAGQMVVQMLSCHRTVPNLEGISINILIRTNLPLQIGQKLVVVLLSAAALFPFLELHGFARILLSWEQLVLLIHRFRIH